MPGRSKTASRVIKWTVVGLAAAAVAASAALVASRTLFKDSADDHIARAKNYTEAGQLPEAILEYRRALQIDQQRGDARLALADAYAQTNDAANAIKEYVRASDLLPNNNDAQLKAASGLLLAGRFDEARARADSVLTRDTKNTTAQILRGNALAGLKDFDGAIKDYENAVSANPSQHEAFVNLGTIQFLRGNRQEAEAAFRKAIDADPKSVQARLALANFLWASNKPADAEETLKAALGLDARNMDAHRALATFYMATGRVPDAESHVRALALAANTPAGQTTLAQYYVLANRRDEARRVLNELQVRKEGESMATVRLAALDALDGQRAQGEQRLRDFLAKNPADLDAQLLYGELLIQGNKRDEADAVAKAAIALDGNAPRAHALAAAVALQGDRHDVAKKEFETVLSLDPKALGALLELSRLELTERNLDKSLAYAQQALDLAPGSPLAQSLLVRVLLAQGQQAKAEAQLSTLQQAFPNAVGLLNLQALVALAKRDAAGASAAYAKALALDPANLEALSGLVNLDVIGGRNAAAIERLDAATKRSTQSVDFLLTLAKGYGLAGERAKAESALKTALDADPGRLQTYSLLGRLYASQGRLDEALLQFEGRLKRDPDSIGTLTMVGMLHEAKGNLAPAEKSYQHALSINPRAAVPANNLAWIFVDSGRNLDDALRLAQAASEQLPNEPAVNDTLGWILVKKEMAPRAVPHLEAAAKANPDDASFRLHLGLAYYKVGDWRKASDELTKALSLQPTLNGADEAKKVLAIIGPSPKAS